MTSDSDPKLDLDEIVKEKDSFKLVILGFAAIESLIDAGIAEGFRGSTPPELRRLPFRSRLALFVALTQLPKKYATAIGTLAQLRHDFAHGRVTDLTPERMQAVVDAFRPTLPEQQPALAEALDASKPRIALVTSLHMARAAVDVIAAVARGIRERERRALGLEESLRQLLDENESR